MLDWKEEISRRLANLNLEPTREAEIVEELSQHPEDRYQELLDTGVTAPKARQLALGELTEGDVPVWELRRLAQVTDAEPSVMATKTARKSFAGVCQDLRYAARTLI